MKTKDYSRWKEYYTPLRDCFQADIETLERSHITRKDWNANILWFRAKKGLGSHTPTTRYVSKDYAPKIMPKMLKRRQKLMTKILKFLGIPKKQAYTWFKMLVIIFIFVGWGSWWKQINYLAFAEGRTIDSAPLLVPNVSPIHVEEATWKELCESDGREYRNGVCESVDSRIPRGIKDTSKEVIARKIISVFGEHAEWAFKCLKSENARHNPNAMNYNRNGSIDTGIFQVNSVHCGKVGLAHDREACIEELKKPEVNIKIAKQIFDASGSKAWYGKSCN